ncbi:MAG: dodecin domain-containing protein [Parcubacteria group bacterium CG_4_10_14_0_8_um_filter_35_7]|nr:MAG: dodecin [Parcubacteria group bacterium CG23_combo_of_CG06-09_8_20_14_all_35_9]PIY78586.1 MAG: dodecin domain-containing protein [Parcubacteria group bacterium CG_4_10_14_0_8_um_filter_35_7]
MPVIKIIELIGSSPKSFDDALKEIIKRTTKTVEEITGIDIISQKVRVENNKIVEYKIVAKVAFVVK